MFTLETELEMVVRSVFPIVDHSELPTMFGDSSTAEVFPNPFRCGIFTPRPVIVGDESGEDCSASVEW
jgi:hypothetical protein